MSFKGRGKAKHPTEYVLYKGDQYVYGGTAEELAKYLNVNIETINYYASPTYKKRYIKENTKRIEIYKVEEDNDNK